MFALSEFDLYAEQLKLPEVGIQGQKKLKTARVLCVGAGGLGSPLLLYLAAAGIGNIGVVDSDVVELSNLHRQVLYQQSHVGQHKAVVAASQLQALNPHIHVKNYPIRLNENNISDLIQSYDIVADCSDNFATRYLINDTCYQLKKPFVFAAISQWQGQCALFSGKVGPCLRCLFPQHDLPRVANCREGGVIGVLPGLLGMMQAAEIIKWQLEVGNSLSNNLLTFDLLNLKWKTYSIKDNLNCLTASHYDNVSDRGEKR